MAKRLVPLLLPCIYKYIRGPIMWRELTLREKKGMKLQKKRNVLASCSSLCVSVSKDIVEVLIVLFYIWINQI